MILFCRLRWLTLCESKRGTPGGVSPAIGQATLHGIRPLQPKGPPQNKSAPEKAKQNPSQPGQPGPPME